MSTAGTKGVARADRERQILDLATEEFGRNGYAGVSIASVAARAGISKPLIYGYFRTKEGLYVACVERAGRTITSAVEPVLNDVEPTMKMAEETLRVIFTALEPRPHDWNVIWDRTLPAGSEAAEAADRVRGMIAEQSVRGVESFIATAGLTDPMDHSVLTEIWLNSLTALLNWWLRHPEETAEQMVARSRRVIAALSR